MFGGLSKVRTVFAGMALLCGVAMPVMAADYQGHGGNMVYRGMHGGMPGSRVADTRNWSVQGRPSHQRGDRGRFEHGGFGGYDRGMTAQNEMRNGNHSRRFEDNDGYGRFHANHLPRLASGDFSTGRGNGISVIDRSRPDYDFISNYAGSIDVYHADGGTYIAGYADGGSSDGDRSAPMMRPRATVIDVAKMHDACAYENGVCVIRP